MPDLFDYSNEPVLIDLPDAELVFFPALFSGELADCYYDKIMSETEWQQEVIQMYGKEMQVPRLSAWYADNAMPYTYSGITHNAHQLTPALNDIREAINKESGTYFNSVLLNLYRNQNDSVAWHSDDEPELGNNPVIASVSLGQEREFQLRNKQDKKQKYSLILPHGSLLIMKGTTQHYWEHQIAKVKREMEPRVNLTYRMIQ